MKTLNEKLLVFIPKDAKKVDSVEMWERRKKGFLYGLHPNGNLKFFGRAEKEETILEGKSGVVTLLTLDEEHSSGHFEEAMWGQTYYQDGRMEDFSAWDDSSTPYPATTSFADWALSIIKRV